MHLIGLYSVAQSRIHTLMALNEPLAFEFRRDDHRAPMPAIAIDLKVLAIETGMDDLLKFRSLHITLYINLYPRIL